MTPIRWATALGGWTFFIAENFALSENRSYLIDQFGEANYRLAYGSFSTAATSSIAYGYYKLRKSPGVRSKAPAGRAVGSWVCMSIGVFLASQALPAMQVPFDFGGGEIRVLCPFDFAGKERNEDSHVHGIERITRHASLWSLGFVGLGNSLVAASPQLRLFWTGPAFVALLGGSHQDSRFRRGMGGHIDPVYDSVTSNLPFWALLSGKQGSGCWSSLKSETKELNALASVAASTIWILLRIR